MLNPLPFVLPRAPFSKLSFPALPAVIPSTQSQAPLSGVLVFPSYQVPIHPSIRRFRLYHSTLLFSAVLPLSRYADTNSTSLASPRGRVPLYVPSMLILIPTSPRWCAPCVIALLIIAVPIAHRIVAGGSRDTTLDSGERGT